MNQFGCALFSRLLGDGSKNVALSPLSAWFALVMAWYGAEGETRAELARVLDLDSVEKDQVGRAAGDFLDFLQSDPDLDTVIANSAWVREGIELLSSYVERITSLRSAVFPRNFGDARVVDEINAWVREHTRGRIGGIVDSLDPSWPLILVNAIAFQGAWTDEFDPHWTRDENFHSPSGTVRVPLMRRMDSFQYQEAGRYQAVRLPYGARGRFSFHVYLPRSGVELTDILGDLDADRWQGLSRSFVERRGKLWLPRFGVSHEVPLGGLLSELGLRDALHPGRADFGALTSTQEPFFVGQVSHRVRVDVHEQGTEAAAVTAVQVGMAMYTPPPPPPFEMRVDRPFLFAIADDTFATLLFLGAVTDPARG